MHFRSQNPIPFLIDFIRPISFAFSFFKFEVDFSRNERNPAASERDEELSLADKSTSLSEPASRLDLRLETAPGSTDARRRSLPIASLSLSLLNVSESSLKFDTVCLNFDFFSLISGDCSTTFCGRLYDAGSRTSSVVCGSLSKRLSYCFKTYHS